MPGRQWRFWLTRLSVEADSRCYKTDASTGTDNMNSAIWTVIRAGFSTVEGGYRCPVGALAL